MTSEILIIAEKLVLITLPKNKVRPDIFLTGKYPALSYGLA
jgi:hypothetical protein